MTVSNSAMKTWEGMVDPRKLVYYIIETDRKFTPPIISFLFLRNDEHLLNGHVQNLK